MLPARQLVLAELSFLTGVVLATRLGLSVWAGGIATVLALVLLLLRQRWVVVLLPLLVLAGMVRMISAVPSSTPGTLLAVAGQEVSITGIVATEADRRIDGQRLTVATSSLNDHPTHGRVLVRAGLYPTFTYGDVVRVHCMLERPAPVEDFAYDEYLALSGIFTVCAQPHVTLIEHGGGNLLLGRIFALKSAFLERVGMIFPEPHAALLGGLLVGARRAIPEDILTAFRRAGLTHIIALSGFNITILAAALFAAGLAIGLHRRTVFFAVLAVLLLFVLLTGAPASVVRASLMGVLVLLSRRLGRPANAWYALTFAATLMVLINPRVLLSDVGFQLSFLSTLGLLTVSPWLTGTLTFLPTTLGLREAVAATLGATFCTLPLIVSTFGMVSIVSLAANILVLPVIPLTMLLGFLAVLLPVAGPFLGAAAWLLLTWMLAVPTTLGGWAFAALSVPHLPAWCVALLVAGVAAGATLLARRTARVNATLP